MKCLLISTVFQNRHVILKFYEPKHNKLILYDVGEYHQYCYILPKDIPQVREMAGIKSIELIKIRLFISPQAICDFAQLFLSVFFPYAHQNKLID